jgi:hypothetical protein
VALETVPNRVSSPDTVFSRRPSKKLCAIRVDPDVRNDVSDERAVIERKALGHESSGRSYPL